MIIFGRFESLTGIPLGTPPTAGNYQFRFLLRDSENLSGLFGVAHRDSFPMPAAVNGQAVTLPVNKLSGGYRSITSCAGAYETVRELGQAIGLHNGDYIRLSLQADDRWLLEAANPPDLFFKLGTWLRADGATLNAPDTLALFANYLRAHPFAWFGARAGTGLRQTRVDEYRRAAARGRPVHVYFATGISAGGSGQVEYHAEILDVVASSIETPRPGPESPDWDPNSASRVWLKIGNLKQGAVPLDHFIVEEKGRNLEEALRGSQVPLVYVRHVGPGAAFRGLDANSFSIFARSDEPYRSGDPVGAEYRLEYWRFRQLAEAVAPTRVVWHDGTTTFGSWQKVGHLKKYFSARYREGRYKEQPTCLALSISKDRLWAYLAFDHSRWDGSAQVQAAHNRWLERFDPGFRSPAGDNWVRLWTTVPDGPVFHIQEVRKDPEGTMAALREACTKAGQGAIRIGLWFSPAECIKLGPSLRDVIQSYWADLQGYYHSAVEAESQAQGEVELIASSRNIASYLTEMQEFIAAHQSVMYWWSYPVQAEYREMLRKQGPFWLNIYGVLPGGGRAVTHRARVEEFATRSGAEGIPSPYPNLTLPDEQDKFAFGSKKSEVARTWFRVSALEELTEPVPLGAFVDFAGGEAIPPQALLNAFAYVRRLQPSFTAEAETAVNEEEESSPEEVGPVEAESNPGLPLHGLGEILAAFAKSGELVYDQNDLINLYHALHALEHKHFVILHGVSGTGKSQFAQAYANALYGLPLRAEGNRYFRMVAVQPTWQDRTALLGYFNPLTGSHVVPDFLRSLLQADRDREHDYVVCLDEMNLAVVEHYFADFLSAWESREKIPLYTSAPAGSEVPDRIAVPPNFYVIGTVNIDETTHGFSPKVLDRAYTVELTRVDVQAIGKTLLAREEAAGHEAVLQRAFDLLETIYHRLLPHGLHFGNRTVLEVGSYLLQNTSSSHPLDEGLALDLILTQKILPKLRGDDRLMDLLKELQQEIKQELGDPPAGVTYRAPAVLERMYQDAKRFGTFQYWR